MHTPLITSPPAASRLNHTTLLVAAQLLLTHRSLPNPTSVTVTEITGQVHVTLKMLSIADIDAWAEYFDQPVDSEILPGGKWHDTVSTKTLVDGETVYLTIETE